jgi:lipopolysaccharide transport system ATP-binding protein
MTAAREWTDSSKAPQNEIARLRAVRAKTEAGEVSEAFDIRRPIQIEVEYDVLEPGHVLVANLGFDNEEGVIAFIASDRDAYWQRRPRPAGRYTSIAWIPGNFLAEGRLIVGAGIVTEDPFTVHCDEPHSIAFQVIDSMEGDTARGDYSGRLPGVVRPLLKWQTHFHADERSCLKGKSRLEVT